jgi:hypothetical protein
MYLVGERNTKNVYISGFGMHDIGLLSFFRVSLFLSLGGVGQAIRTGSHHPRDALAEPILNVLQSGLATLILDTIVKKCCNGQVLVATVF